MNLSDLMKNDTKQSKNASTKRDKSTKNRSDRKNDQSRNRISTQKRFQNFTKDERYILYEGLIKLSQMRKKLWQNSRSKDVRDKVLTLLNLTNEMEKM